MQACWVVMGLVWPAVPASVSSDNADLVRHSEMAPSGAPPGTQSITTMPKDAMQNLFKSRTPLFFILFDISFHLLCISQFFQDTLSPIFPWMHIYGSSIHSFLWKLLSDAYAEIIIAFWSPALKITWLVLIHAQSHDSWLHTQIKWNNTASGSNDSCGFSHIKNNNYIF